MLLSLVQSAENGEGNNSSGSLSSPLDESETACNLIGYYTPQFQYLLQYFPSVLCPTFWAKVKN